jgi:hypothetical protein
MEGWIDRLARALGEDPPTQGEVNELLGVARDVAHRVERKITPLASFLLGEAVGRELAAGATRDQALPRAIERLRTELPDAAAQTED